ncbi:conserved hypothetical protein [Vibrio chagasii]|uniref:EAL domain-containing protein n=1 Tax=Vibrio TaxID=662 RepID=UPI000E326E2E|nr:MULTISPECIES: EAL domain-containing protein [Vibrio]MCG9561340.1 EAL domain-containing protein [Vibrio chagasii]MCG9673679.1 EAL domain-containing protein [Vibrio chagasii]CAH6940942.1 conserved hypothetical protein [Vibrio chagasii]CAH6952169.1 conserved hypothetical protein [Vibrio chagasii]CAH6991812.1 conserved hypothetical protein [Vibrio chagasii]
MNKNVLIVDDVELSREVLKHAVSLTDEKVGIQCAENAFDAIEKIKGMSFDLIIMDIMMPDGDGFELLQMMSHHGVASKIIITSGLDKSIVSSASMLGKLYELDVIASLEKPIWSKKITHLVNKAFSSFRENNSYSCLDKVNDDNYPINLVYQPQVASDSRTVFGFEVLSRWSDENGSLLPPSGFLPLIEKLGKQKLFTSIVIKRFIQDYQKYFRGLDRTLSFSLNIDPNLLVDNDIMEQLVNIYDKRVEHTIVIELLEKNLTKNIEKDVLASVLKLRLNGFEISIDDFGIEFSNIERIIKLPINEIKIDKKITWGIRENIDYLQKVNEVKELASVKNARVIYEGVEDENTSQFLETIGGYNQQGYFFGAPSLPELIELIIEN